MTTQLAKTGVTVATWLRPDEAALLRARADAADRSVAAEIRRALRDHLGTDQDSADHESAATGP
jgi:plasmid stability protein